ncbi:serine proteinase stubble-like isoform X2 [Aphis craccivora]|uniref:Phenoloxidase-activating factor 2 n=1 Tax=Aphis craccivora TaxID=307492 RepID=A0A6G0YV22_APHCR|nr:serine proteinase stubble-like isoform X2 [Aphis craccivora]
MVIFDNGSQNYTMHILSLILFIGMVSSSIIGSISITKTIGFLASELQSTTENKLTTVLESSTLTNENDDDDCICTPYHKCKSYKAAPDGNELIDVRINVAPCQSYFDVCCNDTRITSTEKYESNIPDTTPTNCYCLGPEDYSKEPNIDQIDVTQKQPSYTETPFDGHTGDHTKETYVSHNEDNTKKPYDGQTGDHIKETYGSHNEDNTKKPYDGQANEYPKKTSEGPKEDYTKKPFDGHTEDYTKETHVSHNEDNTKKPYGGQANEYPKQTSESPKEDYTKKPFDGHTGDHTKETYVSHNEDNTKKPYDGHTGDHTKETYVNHNEDNTKKPYESQTEEYTKNPYDHPKEDYSKNPHDGQSGYTTKEPSVDNTYEVTDKSNNPEHIISTEPDKTSYDHHHVKHKCGTWNKYGAGFRIGNTPDGESQFGEFPSMVAIFKEELSKDGEKKLVMNCGGSLIEKDVILTAAHCVIKKDISTLVVRAGEWDLKTEKELLSHQDRRVSKVVTHPDYYAGGLYNDVALIFTENPFSLQDNIQLICLPSSNDMFIHDTCYSSGWGKTVSYNNYTIVKKTESGKIKEFGQYQVSILKKVELPIVPRSKCMDLLRTTRLGPKFVLHDSFICAGGIEGKDTCKGDGGSPLMCPYKDDPDHLVQVGIVAWGINCGLADIPAAYVNVAGFVYWIKNEIEKKGY